MSAKKNYNGIEKASIICKRGGTLWEKRDGEFIILNGEEVIESIYYYSKDSGTYIEKTYQGIYEIDMDELKGLIRNMK